MKGVEYLKHKKMIILSILILALLLIIAGCGASGSSFKDGTYEGSSDAGMHAGLKVSVTVKGGSITAIEVVEHGETEGIGTVAFEPLTKAIVEAQSTEVDSVSGASKTSAAIKEAVDTALAQAK